MDHSDAVQLQAAVKYVLGELPQAQRDEYEEHCFDCAECALDLKAAAAFVDTTREVLRQEKANQLAKESAPARSRGTGVRGSAVDHRLSKYGHDSPSEEYLIPGCC